MKNNYIELREKIRLKSSKNRFLSCDLSQEDKMKLYQINRIYSMEKFKQVVHEKELPNIHNLANIFSGYSGCITSRVKTGKVSLINKDKERNINTANTGMLGGFSGFLTHKNSATILTPFEITKKSKVNLDPKDFKDHKDYKEDKDQKSGMIKSSSAFFNSKRLFSPLGSTNITHANNDAEFEGIESNTYLKLTHTDNKKFGETFNETFNEKRLKSPILQIEKENDMHTLVDQYVSNDEKLVQEDYTNLKLELARKEKEEKGKQITMKYNLDHGLTKIEKLEIDNVLKDRGILLNNKKIIGNKKGIKIIAEKVYFQSPYKSSEVLRKNNSIHDLVMNIRVEKQINLFKEKYDDLLKYENGLKNMPNVRITNIKKKKKLVEEDEIPQDGEIEIEEEKQLSSNQVIKVSREAILQNTSELPCYYIKRLGLMPSCRSFASFVVDESKGHEGTFSEGILYGGINGSKLDDIWKLSLTDTSSGETMYKWKKLIPKQTDTFYPRYGHSVVYHENQLIIFGGATDYDPIESPVLREDILIYDIGI